LDALTGDYRSTEVFTDREKLAIEWAEEVTRNSAKHNRQLFAALSKFFNAQEIVELTINAAMFNMINRINDSLHVELEEQELVDQIKASVFLDEGAMSEYVRRAADI